MNIVFFGSSQFALPSLEAIIKAGHNVSCVVTQPDKKKGRGMHVAGTQVKAVALEERIAVYQPADINYAASVDFLQRLKADLFVVVSYGQILSDKILSIPRIFCLNAHASLLPKYRGAAPINWAIINGENITGVTIIRMSAKMDAGEILTWRQLAIPPEETAVGLEAKLSLIAANISFSTWYFLSSPTGRKILGSL